MAAFSKRAGLISVSCLAAVAATAQSVAQQDTGSELYLDLSTGLSITDNYESLEDPQGDTSLWFTDLTFGYSSETKSESLSLEFGGRLEFGDYAEDPDNNGGWIDPFASASYSRESSTSLFRGAVSYRERDNGIDVTEGFDSSTDLIVDQGTRSDARVQAELQTGIGTPVRTSSILSYHQRRFFDTSDPDLSDRDTFSFDGEIGLAITRSAELLLVGKYDNRDDLDDINDDEEHTVLGIGIGADIYPDMTFRGVLQYERDKLTETVDGQRETTTEHSPTLDLSVLKDLPNGALRFSFGGELDSNGVRTTAEVGRSMETTYGDLDFSLGVTRVEEGDIYPVGTVDWTREYKTRQLGLNYSSGVATDDDGDQVLNNRLTFEFFQDLTEIDALQLEMNVSASENIDGNDGDYRQAGLSVSYSRDLNRNWSFVTGYSHSFAEDDDEEVTTVNEVFARLDRRFSLRP
ncbi:hypothetical protein R3X27_22960 [Tropicimonas sp. TH_r6]|uniref:hypothetical protein n=1 Tax=Tropicimonas sp. TH_r6 TaxID=3082085 RepID=UPI002952C2A8|nr:hypothetical protein [Tropicimonas sp. TH_r6]MDV7145557.1 hypothetical protein [Tropicimonas sp. TH_r6]